MGPAFAFVVTEVFSYDWLSPAAGNVILAGRVEEGMVRVGSELMVQTRSGPVPVILKAITHLVPNVSGIDPPDEVLTEAAKGARVGLQVTGITKDRVAAGDRVNNSPQ